MLALRVEALKPIGREHARVMTSLQADLKENGERSDERDGMKRVIGTRGNFSSESGRTVPLSLTGTSDGIVDAECGVLG